MIHNKIPRSPRSGFTLIELLVSMALTLFIMLILTQAFTTSLDTFSRLKIVGEMQGQLRNVATILAGGGMHAGGGTSTPMMTGRIFFLRLDLEFNGKEK